MAVIKISISSGLLEEVNKYKKIVGKNRSEFFIDAAKFYLRSIDYGIAFENRKKAVKKLVEISNRIKKEGLLKDIDFVKEIRDLRKERTDELLGRIK